MITETGSRIEKKKAGPGVYVRRNVTNGHDIVAWGKSQGFKQMLQPGDMHVTIAHSDAPVDMTAAGTAPPSAYSWMGDRRVTPLGPKGAVVLHFCDQGIEGRHQQLNDAGALWNWPSFQPHVTLTYNGGGLDTGDMVPYDGPIEFGPEIHEPLDTSDSGWSSGVVEKQRHFVHIEKIDDTIGIVFGWAIICKINGVPYYDLNIDKNADGSFGERVPEHITEPAMLKAAPGFAMGGRPGNIMHDGPDSGSYPFVFPVTEDIAKAMGWQTEKTGLAVGYKPTPEVLAKYRSGEFTGFSIEGSRIKHEESY